MALPVVVGHIPILNYLLLVCLVPVKLHGILVGTFTFTLPDERFELFKPCEDGAILAGFEKLKSLIREGKGEGANKYAMEFDWYKANQKKIIKDWDMPDYNW